MKIIVPMAGMGKRMRPHTLTIPKPLLPIAGKTIVERLVLQIAGIAQDTIDEVVFVISPKFGSKIESDLKNIAEGIGARGSIAYQEEALGTAHAIYCAGYALQDQIVIAFADTLFDADFVLDPDADGVIWVKKIEDPRQFGVVEIDDQGAINNFVEKPDTFVSDLAIIGIYYVKDGAQLQQEIQYLLDHDIKDKGEFQLTNALENMKNKGARFRPGAVNHWMDCGNKDATVGTNADILRLDSKAAKQSDTAKLRNSVVVPPCYIGDYVVLENSVVGPYVSIESHTVIRHSVIRNSIVMSNSQVENANLKQAMIGNHVHYAPTASEDSIGDYSQLRNQPSS